MSKYIELSQGYRTLVDDEDYDELSKHMWSALVLYTGEVYAVRSTWDSIKTHMLPMHRQLLGLVHAGPYIKGDHINGDTLDNRRTNLRAVTQKQNGENRRGLNTNNTSGVRGVSYSTSRRKYIARVKHNYVGITLGYFDTLEEAAKVASDARAKLFTHYTER